MPPSPVRFPFRLACVTVALAVLGAGRLGSRMAPPLRAASAVAVQVTGTIVNLRAGPGLTHAVRGQARQASVLTVQGRSADDAWLAVADPEGGAHTRWIAADRTDVGARRYALPWAGPPRVCTRSADVQAALRAAWAAHGRARPCAEATWADLAALTALPPGADDRLWLWEPHDLAGLTGLRAARVVVTDAYAAAGGRLSGLASLERLDLQGACCAGRPWPSHFLAGAARLRELAVAFPPPAREPTDFPPPGFLSDATRLERLTLEAGYSATARPFDFLAHTPHLHTLVLHAPLRVLPAGFLAHAPQLRTLTLPGDLAALPAGFLAHAPQLRTLILHAPLTALPDDFLAHAPQLRTLTLHAPLTALPDSFLAHAPQLRTLALSPERALAWPATDTGCQRVLTLQTRLRAALNFLHSHAPCLQRLELALAMDGEPAAAQLMALPQLEALTLYVDRATAWLAGPSGLLAQAPRLRTLELYAAANDWGGPVAPRFPGLRAAVANPDPRPVRGRDPRAGAYAGRGAAVDAVPLAGAGLARVAPRVSGPRPPSAPAGDGYPGLKRLARGFPRPCPPPGTPVPERLLPGAPAGRLPRPRASPGTPVSARPPPGAPAGRLPRPCPPPD